MDLSVALEMMSKDTPSSRCKSLAGRRLSNIPCRLFRHSHLWQSWFVVTRREKGVDVKGGSEYVEEQHHGEDGRPNRSPLNCLFIEHVVLVAVGSGGREDQVGDIALTLIGGIIVSGEDSGPFVTSLLQVKADCPGKSPSGQDEVGREIVRLLSRILRRG